MDKMTFSRTDQSVEPGRTQFSLTAISAANYEATATAVNALSEALDGISLSNAHSIVIHHALGSGPKSNAGNRELKWLVRVTDTSNSKAFSYEVPCANDSLEVLNVGGKTILDPTSDEWIALGSAISAIVKSPYANGVTLTEVELVGRNL